jgi:hypothetical protein
LPLVPVFLSSVSEPCPYPSCLCRPSLTSICCSLAAGLYDHNLQTVADSLARAATSFSPSPYKHPLQCNFEARGFNSPQQ